MIKINKTTVNRRLFFKAAGIAACVLAMGCTPTSRKTSGSKPNIVIIYADDMGYGDLNIQNPSSKIPTPNLDRLAREGIRFTNGHSSSGICTPSRYALLTGRYHWRKFHRIVLPFGPSVFAKERLTLPEMLKEKGYTTACVGKWHLGWDWSAIRSADSKTEITDWQALTPEDFAWDKPIPDGPLDHGFDYYFGDDVPNFPPYTWFENDRIPVSPTMPYQPDPVPEEGNPEGRQGPMAEGWKQDQVMPRLTEKAVEWIGKQKGNDQPFFLYFPWTSPHAPILPAEEFKGKTKAGPYGDFVYQSDWSAGQVIKALEENGFADNTLVFFTSDNGPERYAYERIRNFDHRSMGQLRGLKRDIFEGGHRVPFIARWPGVIEPGIVSDQLVSQVDIMATIASVIGYELPDSSAEDSHDLLPLLRNPSMEEDIRKSHIHNTKENHYAIRMDNWVLIDAKSGNISSVPEWFDEANDYEPNPHDAALYDLNLDIAQRKNLITENPEKAGELKELLNKIRDQGYSAPRLTGKK